jgi:hypothetical protein
VDNLERAFAAYATDDVAALNRLLDRLVRHQP